MIQFLLQNSKPKESSPYNKGCSVGVGKQNECLTCAKFFPSFYSLQKHKNSAQGKLSQIRDLTVNLKPIIAEYFDQHFPEELTACQYFLVDSEIVKGRQRIFSFASTIITPRFLKDLQHVFENLHCSAKDGLAPGFVEDEKYH